MALATRSRRPATSAPQLSDRTITGLTQVFKLLADESRLRIVLTLAREGPMHVSALCDMLEQSQPAVSHHLMLLRMSGLIAFKRLGKFNVYKVDGTALGELLERLFAEAGRAKAIDLGEFMLSFSRSPLRRR
jgi:ArsR family transcriptional regulator